MDFFFSFYAFGFLEKSSFQTWTINPLARAALIFPVNTNIAKGKPYSCMLCIALRWRVMHISSFQWLLLALVTHACHFLVYICIAIMSIENIIADFYLRLRKAICWCNNFVFEIRHAFTRLQCCSTSHIAVWTCNCTFPLNTREVICIHLITLQARNWQSKKEKKEMGRFHVIFPDRTWVPGHLRQYCWWLFDFLISSL